MDGKLIIIILLGLTVLAMIGVVAYNLHFSNNIPSLDVYYNAWYNTPEDQRPSDFYSAYNSIYSEQSNLPPWIPLSVMIGYFAFVGYLYYDDWKYEAPREMFARYGGSYEL